MSPAPSLRAPANPPLKPDILRVKPRRRFRALPPVEEVLRERPAVTDSVERERGEIILLVFHDEGCWTSSAHYRTWSKVTGEIGLKGMWFHDLRWGSKTK